MSYTIDHAYRKDTFVPLGSGWSLRPRGVVPSSIVIHTTSSPHKNTTFENEAKYLRDSIKVSAHYLIGKQGQIAQILHPDLEAWHAGGKQDGGDWTAMPAYANDHSIGIESHVSIGEAWTAAQHDALTWLVRWLLGIYHILPAQVEMHRTIALPHGRKKDPEAWSNDAFYVWRATLTQPLGAQPYRATTCAPVFQDRRPDAPLAMSATAGTVELMDDLTNGWLHFGSGAGFSPLSCWEKV